MRDLICSSRNRLLKKCKKDKMGLCQEWRHLYCGDWGESVVHKLKIKQLESHAQLPRVDQHGLPKTVVYMERHIKCNRSSGTKDRRNWWKTKENHGGIKRYDC